MDAHNIAPMPLVHPQGSSALVLKWNHSVIQEPDFVSEWAAQDNAFHLAWSLGQPCFQPCFQPDEIPSHIVPHRSKKLRVSLNPTVVVSYGIASDCFDHHECILHALNGLDPKPWHWLGRAQSFEAHTAHSKSQTMCSSNSQDAYPKQFDEFACRSAVTKFSLQQQCLHFANEVSKVDYLMAITLDCSSKYHSMIHQASGVHSPLQITGDDLPANQDPDYCEVNNLPLSSRCGQCTGTLHPNTEHHAEPAVNLCTRKSQFEVVATSARKLGQASVVSSSAPRFKGTRRQKSPSNVPHLVCRLEHESPIDEFTSQLPAQMPQDDEGPPHPNLPTQPAFVDDLSTRLARMGYDIYDLDFDIPVRTWYIDHATIRRWTAPRILQLVGPPRGWEQQFSSLWVDQINPAEWFDVTVVYPDPPRSYGQAYVVMDLIVTQSLQMDRFPGLITIIPTGPEAFGLFAVAASFEPYVSGFDIVQSADATTICRFQDCTVTFGWQEIPFTLRRHHVMAHGYGFQIQIRPLPEGRSASSSSSQAGSSTDSAFSRVTTNETAPSRPRTMPNHEQISMADPRFTTPLHLYQLEGHEVVMQLINAQLAQPTHEMANALRVPLNCIEALHIMPIAPDGFPELAIPAVVQRVGDIDRYSTDRLIVIDTIYHHHPSQAGITNQPTVVRAVQRVTSEVTRQQILFKAGVFHYCQYLQEACAVSLDGFLWPVNHVDPRPVSHGSYATVDVPPISNDHGAPSVDTAQPPAGEPIDTELQWVPAPEDLPDDAMQLTQIVAHRTVVSSNIKTYFRTKCARCKLPPDIDTQRPMMMMNSTQNEATVDEPTVRQLPQTLATDKHRTDVLSPLSMQQAQHPQAHNDVSQVEESTSPRKSRPSVRQVPPFSLTQTKLTQFFRAGSDQTLDKPKERATGQTTMHDFFAISKKPAGETESRGDTSVISHKSTPCVSNLKHDNDMDHAAPEDSPKQMCSSAQETEPPVFTTSQGQHPLPQPRPAPRPAWRIHLANIFDELATVVHRATGPTMQIEVWYIHHQSYPECSAPRALELDNIQELWYADMCNLWFDRINRHEPLKVVNVLPAPPFQARSRSQAHIILEQGFSPNQLAVHFTAVFTGGTHYGLFQRVTSMQPRICTRDLIDKYGFQTQCSFRPCNMHSGYIRFQMDVREEIFSGICTVLTVAPPPAEPRHLSMLPAQMGHAHGPPAEDDDISMMQRPPTAPVAPALQSSMGSSTNVIGAPPQALPFDHRMTPAAISEFRATLAWQVFGGPDRCAAVTHDSPIVHTWYLNSDTTIRTEECRTVMLGAQPHTWHTDVIQRWHDRLDANYPVFLHVVTPNPPGTSLQPQAHVIVLQRPNPLWRSALLTVTQPMVDPWHIQYVCAMLDVETDLGQLSFISGVGHPANPEAPNMRIEAKQGQAMLQEGATFPVRHGFWFDIVAHPLHEDRDDDVTMIQLSFVAIRQTMQSLWSKVVHPEMPPDSTDARSSAEQTSALTVTVFPNEPNLFIDARDALSFFDALQAHWQPLVLLQPPERPALIPVITWYLDHIRFPQCFQPRIVLLNDNPEDWIQRIRSAWMDVVLTQQLMHIHLVQPHPPEMPGHIAAHLLIVQQPIEQFRSVLISTFDSALPHEPPATHASIVPTPVAYTTLIALAYRDDACSQQHVTCAAWVGEDELQPHADRPVINGHSLVVAVHRHPLPIADGEAPWDQTEHATPVSDATAPPPPPDRPQSVQPTHQDARAHSKVTIHLEAVIPIEPNDTELDDTKPQLLWFSSEAWLHRLAQSPPCTLHPLPEGIQVPDVCYWPLIHPTSAADSTHQLTLYLDGAANGTHAAWSVIATLNLPIGEVFIGCTYGCVQIVPSHPHWIGAEHMDNIAAELSALAIAQTVALRWPHADHRVCIRPDLSLSRLVADAITTCRSNTQLAQLCRVQGLWLASKVDMWEIRGHQGFAWNELADAVAKWTLKHGLTDAVPSLEALHEFASHSHDVAWTWMQTTHPALAACFPSLIDQQVMQFAPSTHQMLVTPIERTHAHRPPPDHSQWTIQVISANVLAAEIWSAHMPGTKRTGQRTIRLDQQWHNNGTHVVGVQEARTAAGQYTSPHYRIFASGATVARAPLYGCELWIHKSKPLGKDANGKPITLGDAPVAILHADPRRLIAKVTLGASQYTFVVLHAPCQGPNRPKKTNHMMQSWNGGPTQPPYGCVLSPLTCVGL